MLSPLDAVRIGLVAASIAAACASTAQTPLPSSEQVRSATEAVYADPNLPGLKAERKLRWIPADEPAKKPEESPPWLLEFIQWISEAGRWLVWLFGAVALIFIGLRLRQWLALRGDDPRARALVLPTHVRDLDIRPESLPDEIGAAASALWQRGEGRAALSLLYRGALSRLVHGQGVPVRAASTEGECMALASRHAAAPASAFFARLVVLWQGSVYGAREPRAESVLELCAEFDAHLPRHAAPVAP